MKKFHSLFLFLLFPIFSIGIGILTLIIFLSPYGNIEEHEYKLIKEGIHIYAPVGKVFNYLGNSNNASQWSVFVDHIQTINSDQFLDGDPGSIRRCFVNADRTGMKWDEEIIISKKNVMRQLGCYNFMNLDISIDSLVTEQIYNVGPDGKCRLSFTLFLPDSDKSWKNHLKMYITAYRISDIFQQNLIKIKEYNEI